MTLSSKGSLYAKLDPARHDTTYRTVDSICVVFGRPVSVSEATSYLWARPPLRRSEQPPAIWPDPTEPADGGRHKRFFIDARDINLLVQLQHSLAESISFKPFQVPADKAAPWYPSWIPAEVANKMFMGSLPLGPSRFAGPNLMSPPWGDLIVYRTANGHYQIYLEHPTAASFYLRYTRGDRRAAELLAETYSQSNDDMKYYVEQHQWVPNLARRQIRKNAQELLERVVDAEIALCSAGAGGWTPIETDSELFKLGPEATRATIEAHELNSGPDAQ